MDMVKRILGVFLVATGLAAAVLLMATPLIHDGSADYPLWKILNWFMAAGVVVVLVVLVTAFLGKRALGGSEADTTEQICVNLVFYGSIVLAMLFFWEWFWTLQPRQRDRRGRHLAHGLFPDHGRAVRRPDARGRTAAVERGQRL